MIKSYANSRAETIIRTILNRQVSRRLPADIQNRAREKLQTLQAATSLYDLRLNKGNRLKRLQGKQSWFSIRINDQWRVCFTWHDGDAYDVEIVDYH